MPNLTVLPEVEAAAPVPLIDGQFEVDFNAALPDAGGGQAAFAATSLRLGPGFMAVQIEAGWPARAALLAAKGDAPVANLLVPLGHGTMPLPSGRIGAFVICQAPPGPPLSAELRPWPEQDLLETVLRPVAAALAEWHSRHATHRGIRLENCFRAGPGGMVTLGCAWAAPAASRQPCLFEPTYSAACLPAGRGEGDPADDVYALGVLLVMLALGRDPMAGMADDAIIRAKLELGSYDAIVGRNRLPTAVAELARGMLADDPEHRPSAVLLGDPAAARARRAAARPQRRGQRAFTLGTHVASTAAELARAVALHPEHAATQLSNGAIGLWLRRGIGDGTTASRVEDICGLRGGGSSVEELRADALLASRAVAVMDPLAPMTWRKLALWPDGLGPALNHALHTDPAQAGILLEVASAEVALAHGALRPERSNLAALKERARSIRTILAVRQPDGGALRLNYGLNPLIPCASPLVVDRWATRLVDLLPALEIAAAGPLRSALPPMDQHIAAFVAMRRDERTQADLGPLSNAAATGEPMAALRLLARLQERTRPGDLPALTTWLAELVAPVAGKFHSARRRTQLAERLAEISTQGQLPPLLALMDDPNTIADDRTGYQAALMRAAEIDLAMKTIQDTAEPRRKAVEKIVHDITGGLSLAICGLALAAVMFL